MMDAVGEIWAELALRFGALSPGMQALWLVAAGAALGLLAALLFALRPARRALEGARAEVEGVRGTLETAKGEVSALERDLAVARSRAERLLAAEDEIAGLRERLSEGAEERAELRSALETERRQHGARVEELRRMEGEVERKFAALAQDALGKNAERFLGLVTERFVQHKQAADEDLARRQAAIEGLLKPIQENLGSSRWRWAPSRRPGTTPTGPSGNRWRGWRRGRRGSRRRRGSWCRRSGRPRLGAGGGSSSSGKSLKWLA